MSTLSGSLRLLCAGTSLGTSPLGPRTSSNGPTPDFSSSGPESLPVFQEGLTPQKFLRKWSLPRGAKRYSNNSIAEKNNNVLLYRFCRSIYLEGRRIRRWGSTWVDEGSPLKIPTDFPGWVCLIDDRGRNMAPCFSTVGQIAAAHVPYFLSADSLPALRPISQHVRTKGTPLTAYTKSTVEAGEVLRVLGVFHDASISRALWGSRVIDPNATYAQCVDRKDQLVFIPFTARGRLFATATRGSRSTHHVYKVGQLIRAHDVPLKVRIVCGPIEWKNETVMLCRQRYQDVIIGCKPSKDSSGVGLTKKSNFSFFEIPIESADVTFTDDTKWTKSSQYKQMLRFCNEASDVWRCDIRTLQYPSLSIPNRKLPTLPPPTPPGSTNKSSSGSSSLETRPALVYRHSEKKHSRGIFVSSGGSSGGSRQRSSYTEDSDSSRFRFDVFESEPPYSTVLDATYEEDEDIYAEVADSLYNPDEDNGMLVTTRSSRSNKNSEGTNTFSSSAPSSYPTTTLSRSLSSPGEELDDDDDNDSYYARVYRV